jgi:hypothetical protein
LGRYSCPQSRQIAALALKYLQPFGTDDIDWALGVIDLAAKMPEVSDVLWTHCSEIPWHATLSGRC